MRLAPGFLGILPTPCRLARAGLAIGLAAACLTPPPARAQTAMDSREAIALQNEILELRSEVGALRAQLGRGGGGGGYVAPPPAGDAGASSGLAAELLDRVSRLEDQVRTLQGRTDELANQLQTSNADLSKQIGDLSFRLQGGAPPAGAPAGVPGGGGTLSLPGTGPAAGAPTPLTPPGAPGRNAANLPATLPVPAAPAVQPPRTPEVALNEGHAALARRDYAAAIAAAREVLTTGHGPRTVDAQLLLAQAEAGQRNFQQAALDYYDTYNRARTGGHAPEALLGVATSLTELNDKPAACQALDRLRTEFPDPRPDLRAQEVAARSRAGCR